MRLWMAIREFFRDAKLTEFYVKISKEEFQGNLQKASDMCGMARQFVEASDIAEDVKQRNLAKIEAWQRDLQRKISVLGPPDVARERRRFL